MVQSSPMVPPTPDAQTLPGSEPLEAGSLKSLRRLEVLAAVRDASDESLRAFLAAESDRRALRASERRSSDSDLAGDIELFDDALQGLAHWMLSGRLHPRQAVLQDELEKHALERLDFQSRCAQFQDLVHYLNAAENLRVALVLAVSHFEGE